MYAGENGCEGQVWRVQATCHRSAACSQRVPALQSVTARNYHAPRLHLPYIGSAAWTISFALSISSSSSSRISTDQVSYCHTPSRVESTDGDTVTERVDSTRVSLDACRRALPFVYSFLIDCQLLARRQSSPT